MSSPAEEAVKKANRLADGGDGEAAAKVLEEYLSGDPDNRDARLLLARTAVYVLKDADRGIAQLDIILERHPDDPDALKALATVLMKKKKNNKRADECYRKLTETCPDAEVYNAYAVFLRMQMLDFQT
ncbi:MAG: tetratricopeptide repeat protein [Candidatus Methanoplasma sp.]|jgi:Tfp pilus assembly protein PilF|nr:tetratricopeptide repeat protein [Candidatus Methanoplasma sp.]